MSDLFRNFSIENLFDRVIEIFYERGSWAELTSAFATLLYVSFCVFGALFFNKDLGSFASLSLLDELMHAEVWVMFSIFFGVLQIIAVFSDVRGMRLAASAFMFLWLSVIVGMAWRSTPFAPLLAFPTALFLPNLFAVVRHMRDWQRPLRGVFA